MNHKILFLGPYVVSRALICKYHVHGVQSPYSDPSHVEIPAWDFHLFEFFLYLPFLFGGKKKWYRWKLGTSTLSALLSMLIALSINVRNSAKCQWVGTYMLQYIIIQNSTYTPVNPNIFASFKG